MRKKIVGSTKGWWGVRFRINWSENKDPQWHIDLLLAHKIISPVLNQNRNKVLLWRFHRMAARDLGGHLFSFSFYSSQKTAQNIFHSLKADPLLKKMKHSGIIVQDIYPDTSKITIPNIEDTSDNHWSTEIQKTWPYFIMGVCHMWLALINEIAENISPKQKFSSLPKILSFYQQINNMLKKSWQKEGGHALLHHLNAIFGYEPVLVHEVNLRRF